MDTKDIECFEYVYREKSLNQAAKKLYITPQGLGKIIRNLEAELDTVLFERTQAGLLPTKSAHLFHENAATLIRQMDHMKYEIRQYSTRETTLQIGCANGIFHVLPMRTLQEFHKENPQIKMEWNEYENSAIVDLLLMHKLDYGCIVGKIKDQRLKSHLLSTTPMTVLVYNGHPLFSEKEIQLEMLKDEPLLTMNESFRIYHELICACREHGFLPNITAKTMDGGVMFHLCEQKLGLAITPDFKMKKMWEGTLRAIPLVDFPSWDVYGVYLKEINEYENIRRFDSFLAENMGN